MRVVLAFGIAVNVLAQAPMPPFPCETSFCIDAKCQTSGIHHDGSYDWIPDWIADPRWTWGDCGPDPNWPSSPKYCAGNCTDTCSCTHDLCVWDPNSTISCEDCKTACTPGYVCLPVPAANLSTGGTVPKCVQEGNFTRLWEVCKENHVLSNGSVSSVCGSPPQSLADCQATCGPIFQSQR
jgi:hypothetical protein